MKTKNSLGILSLTFIIVLLITGTQSSFSQNENLTSSTSTLSPATGLSNSSDTESENFTVSDSQTILLEGTSLPAGSYLHVYDSTPSKIMNGHISAKIPCNVDFSTDILFLFGPDIAVPLSGLELSPVLSQAGGLCLYRGDIVANQSNTITDIAIYNNSTEDIVFPPTSTIIVRIGEIAPL
ncbi:MAG TPA: hypothetical protein VD815_10510 [Candidatus Saccharimonadales bacterium]|nr:hypothetical protein [Candidatus Saccharimonadales bacterium]